MIIKNPEQIKSLREGGKILRNILETVAVKAVPGVSAYELNELAEQEIKKAGVTGSFKNYKSHPRDLPFPGSLCVSVNDEVVHGMPSKDKILKNGDIVGLDLGIWHKDLCTDGAITVGVGKIGGLQKRLMKATRESLENALKTVKAGNTVGDIGFATEKIAKDAGFEVVRELVGHGVGAAVHEEPDIPCYGKKGQGLKLKAGMVLAIEPMVNSGHWKVSVDSDGWTIRTYDGSLSSHFEHTVVVTNTGCEIMTLP
jgi:methionyl aminopeptidase